MAAVAAELEQRALHHTLQQIYQPSRDQLLLDLGRRGSERFWVCSIAAETARCHWSADRPRSEGPPPDFCMILRKELRGARLERVEQREFDRVLALTFLREGEARTLLHEVMGRHSNLVLLGEDSKILAAAKHVPASKSRARPVLPGLVFEPAPTSRADPRRLDREAFLEAAGEGPLSARGIIRVLNGFSPFAAEELLARAGGDRAADVWPALVDLMELVKARRFEPVEWRTDRGAVDFWALRSVQLPDREQRPAVSMSEAVSAHFSETEREAGLLHLRAELLAAVKRASATFQRQKDEAEQHLEAIDTAEGLRIAGELLVGSSHAVPRGAAGVDLPNYYDPEQGLLSISLDPALSPRENAEQYFRRFRRVTAAAERALTRLPELEVRVAEFAGLAAEIESGDMEALAARRQRLEAQGLLRKPGQPPPGVKRAESDLPPGVRLRRWEVDGWEITWGENATSNDYLTTRVAQPSDTWLHARAVTGAHVLVRGPGKAENIPRHVLEAAARAAAAHSEAKHSSVVAVDYTQRRHVRKPRGAAPGAVLYQREKTLHVDPRGPGGSG